jgi:hypothetical protein
MYNYILILSYKKSSLNRGLKGKDTGKKSEKPPAAGLAKTAEDLELKMRAGISIAVLHLISALCL